MNPQEKNILETFEKFIALGYPFSIALQMTFLKVRPDMTWETFQCKIYQILRDPTP